MQQPGRGNTEHFSFDPGAMSMALQDVLLEHVQLESGPFRGQIAHTATTHTRVDWGRYNLSVLARGDLTKEMVTLQLALAGEGEWRMLGQQVASGDMVVLPENGELLVTLPAQSHWLSLQLPRWQLEATGLQRGSSACTATTRLRGGIGTALWQAFDELAPVLGPQSAHAHFSAEQLQRAHDELLSALLSELVARAGSGGATLQPGERLRVIRRAEDYLESVGDMSVRIDELCVAASTSLSRLERAFREVFGVSPRRFLMLRRLAAVRAELLNGDPSASITEVATRWGFFHLGRFSQEYRLHYAERPSETLGARRRSSPDDTGVVDAPRQPLSEHGFRARPVCVRATPASSAA